MQTSFLKKQAPLGDCTNVSKRRRIESSTAGKILEHSESTKIECTEVPVNQSMYSTTLWDQWETDKLHEAGIDGRGVTIAMVDSGINIAHKAFTGRIVAVNDITCSGNIDVITDQNGHGTLCASIACGVAFKSIGSTGQPVQVPAGVAPGAKIVVYKITGSAGKADGAVITKALKQCLEDKDRYNIDIVLLPYGSNIYDCDMCAAIDALTAHGVLVVTASGNWGKLKQISYPARFGYTICVGAHDKCCNTTPYTSKGYALNFTAPGQRLTGASSVHPSMFATGSGTSYAAACVASLLALIIQRTRDIAASNTNKKQLLGVEPTVNRLLHDQNTIKKVLRSISSNPSEHKDSDGYGHLTTHVLFSDHRLLELLYEDVSTTALL